MNALGFLRVMFTVEDIHETLARLRKCGAQLVGEVVPIANARSSLLGWTRRLERRVCPRQQRADAHQTGELSGSWAAQGAHAELHGRVVILTEWE